MTTSAKATPPATSRLSASQLKTEVLAGLTVALALVPEAVAFAFVAGVNPLVGLYAAFIVCLITSLFGGRPGMISGAAGSLAVVMVSLVSQHGVQYLFATVVLMGIFQILFGIFRLGKFIRMVPHPVMLGFVNGLAIVIFLAQLSHFKMKAPDGTETWMTGSSMAIMLALVALTMAVSWFLPKITKAFPAPLAGILVCSAVAIGFGLHTRSVGDLAAISGSLPSFHIPMVPLNMETLHIIVPYALILAAVGLIETLLTLNLVGEITGTKGGASRECIAQGTANIVTGFFGGMGGCAMIGQSMINVNSGARTRISGTFAAIMLLSFIVIAAPFIEQIPMAALVGVMFMVVISTFAWPSIKILNKIPKVDAIVMILVTIVTVFSDLAIAVVIGVIISALAYAWNSASHVSVTTLTDDQGRKVFRLKGPLFFGSTTSFMELFDPAEEPDEIVLDFKESRVVDHSGLQAIDAVATKYEAAGKKLHLIHLSADCKKLLKKAGPLVEVSVLEDPDYGVAVDYDGKLDQTAPTR